MIQVTPLHKLGREVYRSPQYKKQIKVELF